jgi:hypothetical protein
MKVALGVLGGVVALVILGSIVANVAIDHSTTTRRGNAIEAAQPSQTDDAFCWLYHSQLPEDRTVDPVELAKVVMAGKANADTAGLGVYQIASNRPPEALEPSFDQFTSLIAKASDNKPVDHDALMQAARTLHAAIARQCTPEHSTTSIPRAGEGGADPAPTTR